MNFVSPPNQLVGRQFVHFDQCDSTNHIAQQLIQSQQASNGAVVHADEQLAGRGQQRSRWESASAQNLTLSVIFFPELAIEQQHYLTILASLSVYDTLTDLVHPPVAIKWPNDILCESSKICGILIQNNLKGSKIHSTVIGIGLNVNQDHFLSEQATSLALLAEQYWNREHVLRLLLQKIDARFNQLKTGETTLLEQEYLDNMFWKDEKHLFEDKQGTFYGTIRGVDSSGRLAVEVDGAVRYYDTKELVYKF